MKTGKISWQTLDHLNDKKTSDWFWIVGIVSLSISILAIYFGNILFALLIVLFAFASFMVANSDPKVVDIEINRQGIKFADVVYPYSALESFCVLDEDGFDRDRILLKSRKVFMPLISIPIGSQADPEEIREYLLDYMDEEELSEPITERILHILGF